MNMQITELSPQEMFDAGIAEGESRKSQEIIDSIDGKIEDISERICKGNQDNSVILEGVTSLRLLRELRKIVYSTFILVKRTND